VRLEFTRRTLALHEPMQTSYGAIASRELLAVSITDAAGVSGDGEAAPLEPYDGVSIERAAQALDRYGSVLERFDGAEGGALDACREADELPCALAAIDLALWDRAGKLAAAPVAELLCEHPARTVAVNATLTAHDRATVAEQAHAAAQDGYECVKVKVAIGDDAGRVAAARAGAGADVALRLDANGAWTVEEAVSAIDALSPAGLELVEEPVHGVAAIRELRERVAVRVAIDETAAEPGALAAGAADAVCLKIARCGGISGLLAAATLVRASGAEPYLASTLDGPLGIAAALHAAAALASQAPIAHCGLATLGVFAELEDPLPARGGRIEVPRAPGLGVRAI
jgi:L-alanine-DL-glutamate epimerase-like enolase superfamily enzyme